MEIIFFIILSVFSFCFEKQKLRVILDSRVDKIVHPSIDKKTLRKMGSGNLIPKELFMKIGIWNVKM